MACRQYMEQGSAFVPGGAGLADLAAGQADVVVLAVAGADGEVCGVASDVGGTNGVLAAGARRACRGRRPRRIAPKSRRNCPSIAGPRSSNSLVANEMREFIAQLPFRRRAGIANTSP